MPVLESGHTFSLRIFVILVTFLQQWGVSAGESSSTAATSAGLPPPTLRVESRSSDQVTLVCQAPQSHQGVLFNLFRVTDQVDSFAAPQGSAKAVFRLRAETVATHQQLYCCLYKNSQGVYSAFSPYLSLTPPQPAPDQLPRPTLALRHQGGVWLLSCKGSAAYPGALFYLFQADSRLPVATRQASATGHQAGFSLPVRDQPTVQYECRYSVLLGNHRSESEPSVPLETGLGIPPAPALGAFSVDWPLVAGSFSAVVLFIIAVALFVYMVQRKVRGATDEKKKRKEAEFWSKSQAKDHMADPEPRHSASTSHECASGTADTAPRSSVWNPLSTFSSPSIH
ncbi:unnamed protein product [Arctogadus glacialis]